MKTTGGVRGVRGGLVWLGGRGLVGCLLEGVKGLE